MSISDFPAKFGKYILLDRLNAGGMAEVFRAKVTGVEGFERLVAIKCMLPALLSDESFSNMFIDEARLAAQVTHANVAQIYELGRHAEQLYIAMELVSGRDLRHIIKTASATGKPLPPEFAAYVCSKVAEGLDFAHRKSGNDGKPLGLVHRDISPQNVLVSYDGEVKVVDFGIAKANSAARDTQTQVGVLKGKFAYMSPEQVLGQDIDRRADIFALGSVLYEMVTGKRLFTGESDLTVLERVREGVLPDLHLVLPPGASRLIPVFEQALQVDVDQRFGWASEMAEALEPMLMGEKNIFGPKRAAALMREMFATEVAELAEKLKRYALVNESNCLSVVGESATDPNISPRVFESTFANRPGPGSEGGETGIIPPSRLQNQIGAVPRPPPVPRAAQVQPKLVVPKPATRQPPAAPPATNVAPTTPSVPAPFAAAAAPTQLGRPAGPLEPTVVPAGRSRLGPLFTAPSQPLPPPVGPRSTVLPHAAAAGGGPGAPPRSVASQVQARARSEVRPPVDSVQRVGRRISWVMGGAFVVTAGMVLAINARLPEPLTLSKTVDQLMQLHPVTFAENAVARAQKGRWLDHWLFGSHREATPTPSRYAPSVASRAPAAKDVAAGLQTGAADNPSGGYVHLNVLGAENARVWVDDEEVGQAPLADLSLPLGSHVLRIERIRGDGSSEHREAHVLVEAKHTAEEPMAVTLTF